MSRNGTALGAAVRAAAATIVVRVLRDRIQADDALDPLPAEIDPRDASLLGALVFGTLRWHHRLTWQTARLLTKPIKDTQPELAALLWVGLLQLQHMRIPDHAAVSATVDAAARLGHRDAAGLVNAVLRRFLRERATLERAVEPNLEAFYSHPWWLITELQADWPERWRAILDANNEPGPMWLRVNLSRTTREAYLARLQASGIEARASEQVASAVLLASPQSVTALPGFGDGQVSVQDVAAQRAAELLDLAPGQRVLDACAAPGGKTGHLLEACPTLEQVVAVDRDARRLDLVQENLTRLKLKAELVAGDATQPADWWDGRPFDRILLDAPCSAVGVIRRHPDIKVLRREADVTAATVLQADLLRALWPLLKPGGRFVYATCTVLRRENDAQIEAFCAAEPSAARVEPAGGSPLQSLPGDADGDGFYYACLLKSDVLRSPRVSPPQQ